MLLKLTNHIQMTLNKDISERLNQRFLFRIDENTEKNVS